MEPLAALDAAVADFGRKVRSVPPDRWSAPSPCEGWDARTVVRHVCGGNAMTVLLLGGASREEVVARRNDDLGDDLAAAYERTADAQAQAFRQPGALERTVQHPVMDMPGSQLLQLRTNDVLVHAWDLARAAGIDEALDPDVVAVLWDAMAPRADLLKASGMFGEGASGRMPETAPLQDRLLDLVGRRP